MTDRIRKLIARFSALKVDAVLLTDDVNITYLTATPSHEAWLLITPLKVFYLTDARYSLEVRKTFEGNGIEVVEFEASIFLTAFSLVQKAGAHVLGIDERHITMAQYHRFEELAPKALKMVAVNGVVDELRMIKESGEIALIREALAVHDEAYRFLAPKIKPGTTERKLLRALESFVLRRNVTFSFSPIIASGPNSAMPHARVTDRRISLNEPVLVDMGIDVKGYKSDLTRMFFLGRMPPTYRKVLSLVRDAQLAAIKSIRPGIEAKSVDAKARDYLKKYDLDAKFGHSLGHGVGLEVHEMPRISKTSGVVLAENMVFTVEPGVYFPNEFGIRLEEMVLVTKKGCEVLSVDFNHRSS